MLTDKQKLDKCVLKYSARVGKATSVAKAFARILESPGTIIDPIMALQYAAARAELAKLVGAHLTNPKEPSPS